MSPSPKSRRCGWCGWPEHGPGEHCPACEHLGGDGSLPCDCGAADASEEPDPIRPR